MNDQYEYRIEMWDGFQWIPAFNTWGDDVKESLTYATIDFRLRKLKADWSNPNLIKQDMMPTVVPSAFRIMTRKYNKWEEFERS